MNQSNHDDEDEATALLLDPSISTRTNKKKEEEEGRGCCLSETTVKTRTVAYTNLIDGLGNAGHYTGCIDARTRRPHGDGTMIYPNGDVYEGGWVNGDWSGYGKYTTNTNTNTNTTLRSTTTTDTTATATATATNTKSSSNSQVLTIVYQGGFFDNLKHGAGVEHYYPDGRVYDGTFQLGIMGKGKMSYPDGSLYWGYFSTTTTATTTTTTTTTPSCYSSSSSSSDNNNNNNNGLLLRLVPVPHGRGKLTYADGSVYDGLFSHGSRHGHGRMTWQQDGRWYLGEWVDDQRNGLGIEVLANGTLAHEGTFCSDKVVTCSSFPPKKRNGTSTNSSRDGDGDGALLYRASFPDDRRGARLVGPMPRRISMLPQRNVLAACYCRK
jgi:hypothetical protein